MLHRPAAGPVAGGLAAVGAHGVRRRAQLDQVLEVQAVPREQPDPLAVRQLEADLVVLDPMQPEVVERERLPGVLGIDRPADRASIGD